MVGGHTDSDWVSHREVVPVRRESPEPVAGPGTIADPGSEAGSGTHRHGPDASEQARDTVCCPPEDDHCGPVAGAPNNTVVAGLDRWAVVRSASKTLGPGLRLAVVAGDPTTIARVEGRRLLGTGWVSHVLQSLAASLWSDPQVNLLLAEAADTYTQRRTALLHKLADQGITAQGRSGLNVWIPGWAVSPGERFRQNSPPALRVTIATLTPPESEVFARDLHHALRPQRRTYQA